MSLTPLEEVEAAVHEQFGEYKPTKKEAGEFIHKKYPKMDGGITIAIALAALALQGWQVYRSERDRWERNQANGPPIDPPENDNSKEPPPNNCPECDNPAVKTDSQGKSSCVNGHTW